MKDKRTAMLGIILGVGIALMLILVFFVGIYIGSKKANLFPFWERRFSYSGFVPHRFGHGTSGTIDSIGKNTLVVKDRSGALKTILIDDHTLLRRDRSQIKFSDLKKGDLAIVIGEPKEDEGAIEATVVRVVTDLDKRK
ncbi:MAG: hypothetical protein Q7S38_01470 [bacterium]|nr:hypothetical protein [bacterium]